MRLTAFAGSILALALCAGPALAITWFPDKVDDPIQPGAKCDVQQLGSMGSYVYSWPSRYDGVYHPFVEDRFIWTCKASGFVGFGDDFEKMTAEERVRVAAWLKANPQDPTRLTGQALHDRLETVYRARGMNDPFWAYFYRFRAYRAETAAAGDAWRAKALPLIIKRIEAADIDGPMMLQHLYLAGYYARRAGDAEASKRWWGRMQDVSWEGVPEGAGSKADNLAYFQGMIAAIEAGKLDGECAQTGVAPAGCKYD